MAQSFFSQSGGAVAALVELVAAAPREKVVRVALSALRNLATLQYQEPMSMSSPLWSSSSKNVLKEMIGCGLLKSMEIMKQRQWTDPDILEGM